MSSDAMTQPDVRSNVTVAEALRHGQRLLEASDSETPRLDAEVLLRHLLGIDRTALLARLTESVAHEQLAAFEALLAKRSLGIPVAYLTGLREFMGLPFFVGPAVLVPRPETEILVEWALQWLGHRCDASVVDVGAGSGAIALSLAALLGPDWRGDITASDLSPDALAIAARNRQRLDQSNRVELVEGSLLAWRHDPVDLLLANLPYLRPEQIAGNRQLAAEPSLALDGGRDGLDLIRALLEDAPRVLKPGAAVGLEIDPSQAQAAVELADRAFPGADIVVLRDLAGFERHVTISIGAAPRGG